MASAEPLLQGGRMPYATSVSSNPDDISARSPPSSQPSLSHVRLHHSNSQQQVASRYDGMTREDVARCRRIYVQLNDGKRITTQQVVSLYDGMTREDVAACLATAAGLPRGQDFSLFDVRDASMVPISGALPHGIQLVLRPVGAAPDPSAEAGGKSAGSAGDNAEDKMTAHTAAMKGHTEAVQHFAKVSNYLANERTMLAWTRTALAIGRTSFAIVALKATHGAFPTLSLDVVKDSLDVVNVSMALLILGFFLVGVCRFKSVRTALDTSTVPRDFAMRFEHEKWRQPTGSLMISSVLGCALAVLTMAIALRQYGK